jgi:DNA polymerase alpha subunit A
MHASLTEQINALALYNREIFMEVKSVADAYLNKNGRRYVNMESLFGFMARMTV